MDQIKVTRAIQYLKPEAEFVIRDNNIDDIEWHHIDGDIPTKTEILAAVEIIEKKDSEMMQEIADKKAATENKLLALGLTVDDLKVLGLG